MHQKLQKIIDTIQQTKDLSTEAKDSVLKTLKETDKELEITVFKLERTEKVKKTTAILLEETIEELEQKRKAVEKQNRELEIETALEKVRTIAMGMREPADMLDVCKTISLQLESLDVKEIRNVQTAIFYEQRGTYMNYEYYAKHKKTFITETTYTNHEIHDEFATKMLKGRGEVFITHIKGKDVIDWIAYQKTTNVFIDNYLETSSSLNYYWFSLGPVALGISTYQPLTEAETHLFKRFLKVFELAYRRYLDIEKAEAQAREAQIEASLERVRAVAMGMNKSEDLLSICEVSFKEFKKLGFDNLRNGIIHILNDEKQFFMDYDFSDYLGGSINKISYDSHPIVINYLKQIKKANDAFAEVVVKGNELDDWKEFRRNVGQPDDPRLNAIPALHYYFHSIGVGDIGISTFEPIDDAQIKILKRFRNVFDLAYSRYTDITKAEAQAREAQIELGLERVRARAMAMQKSDELSELVDTVFKELTKLDFALSWCIINIIDESSLSNMVWAANPNIDNTPDSYHMKFEDYPFHDAMMMGYKERATKYIYVLEGIEKKVYDEYLFKETEFRKVPEEAQAASRAMEKYVCSFTFSNFGGLQTVGEEPLSDDNLDILARFGKVFDLTYTRFNDLKKAEAQAREAQIETALERVRSRTMAMHHSDELADTASVLFKQFVTIGIVPKRCSIGIIDKETHRAKMWLTRTDGEVIPGADLVPLTEEEHLQELYNTWKNKKPVYSFSVKGEDRLKWTQHIIEKANMHLPEYQPDTIDTVHILNEPAFLNSFIFNHGFIMLHTVESLNEKDLPVLERFAAVFEQTYTRFLDLKKAEAQAREAQIEASLERVRSRTMAMQRSDELAETAAIVFKQLIDLGIAPNRLYIGIIKDNSGEVEFWITDEDGTKVSQHFTGNVSRNLSMQKMFNGWKSQKKSVIIDMQGDELKEYFNYLSEELHVPFKQGLLQKRRVQNIAYFSSGFIGTASPDSQPEETTDLLERFAAVFNLTYTRFNDLKQAEAQNKIIQAENERKTQELEEARQLQLSMLPQELPVLPNLDIAVYMQTATEVGGDYYDFQVGMDGALITIIGDATGHGMKAGTVVTITKSLFNSMAASESILSTFDKISQVLKGMKFRHLAMCLLLIKIRGNRLSMSSAAMPPALIYRAKNKSVEEILLKGMPLGSMNKFPYKKIESHLNSGDRILLYSDGLPELANESNEMYGYDRIKTEFHSVGEKESEEIVDHFNNSASQWANGKEPDDDVTLVVIKVK